jgi:hypothetical protein
MLWRRCRAAVGWAVPSVTLALIPKCPMCVAGYVALWTGVGLSVPAAARLRTVLIVLCITSIAALALVHMRRLLLRASPSVAR